MTTPRSFPIAGSSMLCRLSVAVVLCCFALLHAADEGTRKIFNLPAGSAEQSLKQFAEQSGRGVVFVTGVVKDVRTKAVQGEHAPGDALRQMLADTGLVATLDPKTGAFAVRKGAADPNGSRAAPATAGDRPASPEASGTVRNSASVTQGTGTISGRVQNIVTGKYLNNARVSVRGTELVVLTDAFGIFRLVNVPSGPVVLEAFYTDLDVQQIPLQLAPGENIEQDIGLTSQTRYGQKADVVTLDPFLVSSDRETDAQAIATNEQRFAPNMKNVMATDSLGDVLGNNAGEFLKFIPGITIQYDNADTLGVSIRGLSPDVTSVTSDGTTGATAYNGSGRDANLNTLSLTNISRMEVTKVPTPATPADSLGGSVNLVSKSAFERSKAEFRYGIYLVGNSDEPSLTRTPHSYLDRNAYKTRPGIDFDYTLPLGKNFGLVVTGMESQKFNPQHLSTMNYNTGGTATGASLTSPYLQSYVLGDGPRTQTRRGVSIKADWRVTPNSVLSVSGRVNRVKQDIGSLQWNANAGTIGTPTIVGGVPLSFGAGFMRGPTGRGSLTMTPSANTLDGGVSALSANYRFDDGRWRVEGGVNRSVSDAGRKNQAKSTFGSLTATLRTPLRVEFSDIEPDRPGAVRFFDNSNQDIDAYDINNYRLSTAGDTPYANKAGVVSANLNIKRRIGVFRFPLSVQVGGLNHFQTRDITARTLAWTYNGPDGNPTTLDTPEPFLMQVYRNQDSHFGFKNLPWISPSRAWAAFQRNPGLFSQTPAQVVSQESTRITNSEYVEEEVSAVYLQAEAKLLANRLNVLGGVRFEKTTDRGEGSLNNPNAVFLRNPDGTFARNAAGNRIRKTEAGTAGSMDELRLVLQERAAKSERSYQGYYPSLHVTYSISENLLARAAYAKTYGRPPFTDIIPRTVVNERDLSEEELQDPSVLRGTLTVRNTGLLPWSADNYDLSLEYYTPQGGIFSAGVFRKEIRDFFGTRVKLATLEDLNDLGLDARYVGWNISSKFNAGDARISGAEFNLRHSLRLLGGWGNYFTAFANGTWLKLEGHQQASFTSFVPRTGNWGFSFAKKRVSGTARWNYRGLDKRAAQPLFGADGFEYFDARTTLDLNAAYQLNARRSLVVSINNVLNVPQVLLRYGSATPGYARQTRIADYGVQYSIGLKGSF